MVILGFSEVLITKRQFTNPSRRALVRFITHVPIGTKYKLTLESSTFHLRFVYHLHFINWVKFQIEAITRAYV